MKYRINGQKYSHNKDRETDRFLLSLLGFVTSLLLGLYKDLGKLTSVKFQIKQAFGGVLDAESGTAFLKTALHNLESKIANVRKLYFKAPDEWYEYIQAYFKLVSLTPRDELETPLKSEEAMQEVDVTNSVSPVAYTKDDAKIKTAPGGINYYDFTEEPGKVRVFRQLDVAIEKLTLSLLGDRFRFLPIYFRKFEPLSELEIPSIQVPLRTNLLYEFSPLKCYLLGFFTLLSLFPEYLILQSFAVNVMHFVTLKSYIFPLLIFGIGKLISEVMTPMVRRFLRSTPKVPTYLTVVAVLAFLITLGYGFKTAINLNETRSQSRIEAINTELLNLDSEIFMNGESPELLEEKGLRKAELQKELRVIQDDPYGGKLVSFITLPLAGGVILIAIAFLFAVFMTALHAVKLKKKADKAQNDLRTASESYTALLSKLESARELYLMCLYFLFKKNVIERMRMLRPSLKDFQSLTTSEMKEMEAEIQESLNSKNSKK